MQRYLFMQHVAWDFPYLIFFKIYMPIYEDSVLSDG